MKLYHRPPLITIGIALNEAVPQASINYSAVLISVSI